MSCVILQLHWVMRESLSKFPCICVCNEAARGARNYLVETQCFEQTVSLLSDSRVGHFLEMLDVAFVDNGHRRIQVKSSHVFLPFFNRDEPKIVIMHDKIVELTLQQESGQSGSVQTSGTSTSDDSNGKETASDETGLDGSTEEGQSRHTVATAALSAGGNLLAVCGDGRNVSVFDTVSWEKVHQW